MARGNQRDKAREKAQKAASSKKKGTDLDGRAFQRFAESNADIMRQKQAGTFKKDAENKKDEKKGDSGKN